MGSRNRIPVIRLYSYPLTHLTSSRIVLYNCPIISILLLGFLQVSVSFRLFPETILNEFMSCDIHAGQLPPNKTAQNKNPQQHLFLPIQATKSCCGSSPAQYTGLPTIPNSGKPRWFSLACLLPRTPPSLGGHLPSEGGSQRFALKQREEMKTS